ncbi:MAG: transglutaminase domain-containing protein [Clostridia bacterium]|nr:transglutaminase domain-containing protein [Clostridia bacterium]
MKNNAYLDSLKEAVGKNIKKITLITKITVCTLAVLLVPLVIALFVDVLGMNIEYTLEAGESLPTASSLCGRTDAKYDFGDEDGEFTVPGEYEIYIEAGRRRIKVKLTVEDTTAPKAELLRLYVNQTGPFPAAIDFFKDVSDVSEVTAKFKKAVNPAELGDYEIQIELSDAYGNKRNYKTVMTLVVDTTAPTIIAPQSITGYVGEAVAYRKDVEVTDNCFGEVTLEVDSSGVNTSKAGSYKVKYTATDGAGNSSSAETVVTILSERITEEKLMDKIASLASSLGITSNMTKEEQVKKIFAYVNSPTLSASAANITFTNESNTDRSDWTREAYLTLQNGSGDCYSYFAVSKAFFEYFGIENRDIQRSSGVTTQSGTHFWSMVNIGTEKNPQWYYYDATRLAKAHRTGSGCLFTEEQLTDYNTNVQVGFLTYDHTGYPTVSTNKINTGYSW